MKWKKGICLILCLLFITGLIPVRTTAVTDECVDGVWASIALTGGANKILFSANSEIENQILYPDAQTDAQYILPEGVAYDAASNTLSLTDFNAPTARLVLTMMGTDFRLRLTGSSRLASICSESKGRGGSVTICGDGSLELTGSESAILVRAGGAADFVRIEPQVRVSANSSESAIRVIDSSLSDGAITFDTSDPQVIAYDSSRALTDVIVSGGKCLDLYTLPGTGVLYGIEAEPVFDDQGERIVYNIYPLGDKDADGLYTLGEELEHNVSDISAYQHIYTPHDWTLVELYSGATASQVRFARFTVTAQAQDPNGALSVSQTQVARGGSVEVRAVPNEGYKLTSLTVNGSEVNATNGTYMIGGITADQTITAAFAEATAVDITLTAPSDTAFKVPADGADPFVSDAYTAVVTDGAGDPVGAVIEWSVGPETEGVSISADGRVTVTNAAKTAAAEGLELTVTASAIGTELNETSAFTVSLNERRAAEVRVTRDGEPLGNTDMLRIPAAGETTTQQYGAVIYDQYGSVREDSVVWSAGDWPVGVRRDGNTLTVSDNCRDGSMLVVTAASADGTISSSFTVSFVRPSEEEQRRGPEPSREAPVITWPDYTLADEEDRVYGITWEDLVTLGDNGSATLGGETLEGAFALDVESSLPNVSDSFKIVFSYQDGEETKIIEGDEHEVTLARKSLDASMVTLSPNETPYTGTAREPAVSLRDGTRNLVAGTDFQVTGYADNITIGTGSVTIEGLGNYKDSVTKNFTITPIPGSSVTSSITSCKPEDEASEPAIILKYGDTALIQGKDYDMSLQYDIPSKSGTATIAFKGIYSGTRILSFDLPNYLITDGAGSSWSKSYTTALSFKANGALGKFTELTVDGKTVPTSYYSVSSGSTIVKIKPDYLKSLSAGKHIVGVAYKDGKALAIFTVIDVDRRGVPTGDSNNATAWIIVLAASLVAFGALAYAFVRSGRKKKKKKTKNSK